MEKTPTHEARFVLLIALDATQNLEAAVEREGLWYAHWVAAVTCLRAVGHVLRKVDAARDAKVQGIIDELWQEWKDDPIFGQIESYRNRTLKEFDFGVYSAEKEIEVDEYNRDMLGVEQDDDGNPREVEVPMLRIQDDTDQQQTNDAVEALWTWFHWWNEQLDRVDALRKQAQKQ